MSRASNGLAMTCAGWGVDELPMLHRDHGTLGGTTSIANAINNSARLVGSAYTAQGDEHAFLYLHGSISCGWPRVRVKTSREVVFSTNHAHRFVAMRSRPGGIARSQASWRSS